MMVISPASATGVERFAPRSVRTTDEMIRFKLYQDGAPATSADLDGAYLIGPDNVPVRGEVDFANGEVVCSSNVREPLALALMWPVPGIGRMMLETTRLVERSEPYNLHVELARGRLVRISQKREDWGLFDFPDGQPFYDEVGQARDLFVSALTAPDDATAARLGDEAVAASMAAGARLGIFHADVFLKRRQSSNQLSRQPFGCRVCDPRRAASGGDLDAEAKRLRADFDFAVLPLRWRDLEPREGEYDWSSIDAVVKTLRRHRVPVHGTALLSFEKDSLPDWAYLWEGDYEQIQTCVARYLERVFARFGGRVRTWEVISGAHAHNDLHCTFDQLMDLTRFAVMSAKKFAPKAPVLIGLTLPWGEYYRLDPRTIPPLLYADMVVRNGISFDAFGLEIRFGSGDREVFVRDPMQISSMLDLFGGLGKPIQVTIAGIPAASAAALNRLMNGAAPGEPGMAWLSACCRIALSKPFVDSVVWSPSEPAPGASAGLLGPDEQSAAACRAIGSLRRAVAGERPQRVGPAKSAS